MKREQVCDTCGINHGVDRKNQASFEGLLSRDAFSKKAKQQRLMFWFHNISEKLKWLIKNRFLSIIGETIDLQPLSMAMVSKTINIQQFYLLKTKIYIVYI